MNHSELHKELMHVVVKLSSDYYPHGLVDRWKDENQAYPDCSSGCKHYIRLTGELGHDWGVCINKNSNRFGTLTFEHQAGERCFEQ